MRVEVKVQGLDELKRQLGRYARQADFAGSKALNTTAFAINARIKNEMQSVFRGGASPYALRAFKVEKSTKHNLHAAVRLRSDSPEGGSAYNKALRHLFTSGTRDWKNLEGYLRGRGLMPAGLMAVPGRGCPLDARGNIRRAALREMLGSLSSSRPGMRTYRRTGGGKTTKAVGYFVILPGARSRLHPGIYKRVETGDSSGISPMVMYVKPGRYRKFIDLDVIGNEVVAKVFRSEFDRELIAALGSAK